MDSDMDISGGRISRNGNNRTIRRSIPMVISSQNPTRRSVNNITTYESTKMNESYTTETSTRTSEWTPVASSTFISRSSQDWNVETTSTTPEEVRQLLLNHPNVNTRRRGTYQPTLPDDSNVNTRRRGRIDYSNVNMNPRGNKNSKKRKSSEIRQPWKS